MTITNLTEVNQALHDFMPQVQSTNWKFALEQMKDLMAALGNPQEKLHIIHVAGTSGKTSTCYYLADMLRQAGKSVGLTVSPHVDGVNERVQVNGLPLPEKEFCQLLQEFLDLPQVQRAQPSYFGVMIAFAYWVFAKKELDYAVIEVGLGGRLDATNVIERADKTSVITDIGLDHTEMLGNDVVTITKEKAEIIKPGNQVFMYEQAKDILEVVTNKVNDVKAVLQVISGDTNAPQDLPLFQQRNWSLARAVVMYLAERDSFNFTNQQAQASARALIPARMEAISHNGKTIIMDGAHNAQKITTLCQSLKQKYPQKMAALVSFAQGKDTSIDESMVALHDVADQIIITTFAVEQDVPKSAIDPEAIRVSAEAAGFRSVIVIEHPEAAFKALMQLPEERLLVTGSFYLLNHIRPLIKELIHD